MYAPFGISHTQPSPYPYHHPYSTMPSSYIPQDPLMSTGSLVSVNVDDIKSNDDTEKLGMATRQVIGKNINPAWFQKETVQNKAKIISILQMALCYNQYSLTYRNETLDQLHQQIQKLEKTIQTKKIQVKKLKSKCHQLKDEENIKRESVKEYRNYLQKLHKCIKCNRYVKNITSHKLRHQNEQQKRNPIVKSNLEIDSLLKIQNDNKEMLNLLLKENKIIQQQLKEQKKQLQIKQQPVKDRETIDSLKMLSKDMNELKKLSNDMNQLKTKVQQIQQNVLKMPQVEGMIQTHLKPMIKKIQQTQVVLKSVPKISQMQPVLMQPKVIQKKIQQSLEDSTNNFPIAQAGQLMVSKNQPQKLSLNLQKNQIRSQLNQNSQFDSSISQTGSMQFFRKDESSIETPGRNFASKNSNQKQEPFLFSKQQPDSSNINFQQISENTPMSLGLSAIEETNQNQQPRRALSRQPDLKKITELRESDLTHSVDSKLPHKQQQDKEPLYSNQNKYVEEEQYGEDFQNDEVQQELHKSIEFNNLVEQENSKQNSYGNMAFEDDIEDVKEAEQKQKEVAKQDNLFVQDQNVLPKDSTNLQYNRSRVDSQTHGEPVQRVLTENRLSLESKEYVNSFQGGAKNSYFSQQLKNTYNDFANIKDQGNESQQSQNQQSQNLTSTYDNLGIAQQKKYKNINELNQNIIQDSGQQNNNETDTNTNIKNKQPKQKLDFNNQIRKEFQKQFGVSYSSLQGLSLSSLKQKIKSAHQILHQQNIKIEELNRKKQQKQSVRRMSQRQSKQIQPFQSQKGGQFDLMNSIQKASNNLKGFSTKPKMETNRNAEYIVNKQTKNYCQDSIQNVSFTDIKGIQSMHNSQLSFE